jgi:hypothetical protein
VSYKYFESAGAKACSQPQAGLGCYPWGTEGPAGDFWNYANKNVYLTSLLVDLGILAVAIVAPFFARGVQTGLVGMAAVLIIGFYSAESVVKLFL